ncbi:MAG: hypothetical protein V1793_14465 [Pseudomonadota bacterium]
MKNRALLNSNSGMALFIVLWAMVLLTVIAGHFCLSMRNEVNMTANYKNRVEAYYLAEAGLNMAVTELMKPEKPKADPVNQEDVEPTTTGWRVNADNPGVALGNGQFTVFIDNESGKIDINTADEGILSVLLNGFNLEKTDKDVIINSILDWRDKDSLARLNGAEDSYYRSLPRPYGCKNGMFTSIEELLLVKGVSEALFREGLETMVTLYSQVNSQTTERPISSFKKKKLGRKSSKININAASEKMLLSLPLMTEELVSLVLEFRKTKDFKSLSEFQFLVGGSVYAAVSSYITLDMSSYYTIRSVGTIDGSNARVTISAVVLLDSASDRGFTILKWKDGGY